MVGLGFPLAWQARVMEPPILTVTTLRLFAGNTEGGTVREGRKEERRKSRRNLTVEKSVYFTQIIISHHAGI